MPEHIRRMFGRALLDVQYGDSPFGARPFGEGLPSDILKLSQDYLGNAYRASYTASFPTAIYVLDVFMKKSKSGVATPTRDRARVLARYRLLRLNMRESER